MQAAEMQTTEMQTTPTKVRRPLSSLSNIAVGALLGTSILCGLLSLVAGTIVLLIAALFLLIAALITTGIRWVPVLGVFACCMLLYSFLFKTSFPIYHLAHPKDALSSEPLSFALFAAIVMILWCCFVALGASMAALVYNYRDRADQPLRWPKTVMAVLVGVLLGGILMAALEQPGTSSATTTANGVPVVHMSISSFSQSSLTLSKGSKLTLIDDGTFHHNLANGTWSNGQPMPVSEAGAPVVNGLDISQPGQTVQIGPFTTAGTYHLYCTIHTGMTLTIIVH